MQSFSIFFFILLLNSAYSTDAPALPYDEKLILSRLRRSGLPSRGYFGKKVHFSDDFRRSQIYFAARERGIILLEHEMGDGSYMGLNDFERLYLKNMPTIESKAIERGRSSVQIRGPFELENCFLISRRRGVSLRSTYHANNRFWFGKNWIGKGDRVICDNYINATSNAVKSPGYFFTTGELRISRRSSGFSSLIWVLILGGCIVYLCLWLKKKNYFGLFNSPSDQQESVGLLTSAPKLVPHTQSGTTVQDWLRTHAGKKDISPYDPGIAPSRTTLCTKCGFTNNKNAVICVGCNHVIRTVIGDTV